MDRYHTRAKKTLLIMIPLIVALMLFSVSVQATYTENDAIEGHVYWCSCWDPKAGLRVNATRITGPDSPVLEGSAITDENGYFRIAHLYAVSELYNVTVETDCGCGILSQVVQVNCASTTHVDFHYCCVYEGFTPGFWKRHQNLWPNGYDPTDTVESVFTAITAQFPSLVGDTLLEALKYSGGRSREGAARTLLRSAVAAILNAASYPDINYPMSVGDIKDAVNDALASTRSDMLDLAAELNGYNNLGGTL